MSDVNDVRKMFGCNIFIIKLGSSSQNEDLHVIQHLQYQLKKLIKVEVHVNCRRPNEATPDYKRVSMNPASGVADS